MQPTMQHFSKSVSITILAIILLIVSGTGFRSQGQDDAPRPPRSRADETLEMWNAIGNKLVAMAKDFPEDKYDFKVQKDERTFALNLLHAAALDYVLIRRISGSNLGPDFGAGDNPSREQFKTKADVVEFVEEAVDDGAKAARSRRRAISRSGESEAIPREMSSRSASVSASRERRPAAGGMPPRGNNTERMQLCGLSRRVQSHPATVPPSIGSKRRTSRSQKVQIVVLASCQHHLYTADLHQMVLHRPVECTAFIRHVDYFRVARHQGAIAEVGRRAPSRLCRLRRDVRLAAEWRLDLIRPEFGARGEGHGSRRLCLRTT